MKQQTQNKIEWKEIELQDVCEVKKGKSITKKTVVEGNVPVIAGGQQPAYYHNIANRTGETITVSGSGAYAGFVAYFNIPIFASDCSTIQTKNKEVSTQFVYSFLKSNQKEIYKLQKGIAQPHIYPKDLAIMKISLPFSNNKPNLQEQERIVSILEKAERQKERGKKVEELLDEYLKSVFNEMFYNKGFEEVELGNKEIFEVQSGGTPSKAKKEYWENGTVAWIGSTACKDLPIYQSEQFITKEGLENSSAKIFPKNTVLIALVGATIGKTGILMFDCSTNQNISGIMVKDNERVDTSYLFFATRQLYPKFMSLGDDAFKMATLSFIRSLKIPLPPLPLQEKFAKIVEKVEKIKENIKKINKNSEELFNSLMQKAFRGEL